MLSEDAAAAAGEPDPEEQEAEPELPATPASKKRRTDGQDKFQFKYLEAWKILRAHPKWAPIKEKNKPAKSVPGDERPQGQKAAKDADKNKGSLISAQQDIANSLKKKNELLENHMKMLDEQHKQDMKMMDEQRKWAMFSSCPDDHEDAAMCKRAIFLLRKKALAEIEKESAEIEEL